MTFTGKRVEGRKRTGFALANNGIVDGMAGAQGFGRSGNGNLVRRTANLHEAYVVSVELYAEFGRADLTVRIQEGKLLNNLCGPTKNLGGCEDWETFKLLKWKIAWVIYANRCATQIRNPINDRNWLAAGLKRTSSTVPSKMLVV